MTVKKDLDEEEPPALKVEASVQVLEVDMDTICLDLDIDMGPGVISHL